MHHHSPASIPRRLPAHTLASWLLLLASASFLLLPPRCHGLASSSRTTIASGRVAFLPIPVTRARPSSHVWSMVASYSSPPVTASPSPSSTKDKFWASVKDRLGREFKANEVTRIYRFCEYCAGERRLPSTPLPYYQPSEEFVEGLSAQPWHDASSPCYPWAKKLEAHSPIIRQELQEYLSRERVRPPTATSFRSDSKVQTVMGGGWTALRLQRFGVWNHDICTQFPKTMEVLRKVGIPFTVRGVCFAKQAAGTGVKPHSDGRNFILTAHLGLEVPTSGRCWMKAGAEKKSWEVGKVIILDTCFEHSTGNESGEDRYVLIVDFWHPEVTAPEQKALRMIYDLRNQFEGRVGSCSSSPPDSATLLATTMGLNGDHNPLMQAFQNMLGGKR